MTKCGVEREGEMKKIVSVLLVVTLVLGLTGCSVVEGILGSNKTTYGDYVISLLDSTYKGEFKKYMELTKESEIASKASYEQSLEYDIMQLLYYCDLAETEEALDMLLPVYRKFAKNASYEIVSVEQESGKYKVTVAVYPYDLMEQIDISYEAFIVELETDRDAGNFDEMSEEDFYELFQLKGVEYLAQAIENSTLASTPIEKTVEIIETLEEYSVSDEDMSDLYLLIWGIE
jgi:hypothetical protein